MRYCRYCGSMIDDNEKFCKNCGANVDDAQQQPNQQQPNYNQNSNPYTYSAPSTGPKKKKDNTIPIVVGIVAIIVVLLVISAFVLPNFVQVEEQANYRVTMTVTQVSINDADNGFQYAEKDSNGRLHTYIEYSCNGATAKTHELGWCPTNGHYMDIDSDKKTITFDTYSAQSQIKMEIYLVVATKVVDGKNHYDYVDLFDVTKYIEGTAPTGSHNYGATGISFTVTELVNNQITLKGDSNPLGRMTLTFSFTKL